MTKGKSLTLLIACLLLLTSLSVTAAQTEDGAIMAEFYVSPVTAGETDGSINIPFASIEEARLAVKESIKDGMTGDIVVYLKGGNYYLDSTLKFEREDSGQDDFNIIYRNFKGEQPVIVGGKPLAGWEKVEGKNYYKIQIGQREDLQTIYENGVRGVPARYPNQLDGEKQYLEVARTYPGEMVRKKFGFEDGEIPEISDTEHLQLDVWPGGKVGYWSWFEEVHEVEEIDYQNNTVTLSSNACYELGTGSKGSTRYFLQGSIELLDAPGEFYYDKSSGQLYYWPHNNDIKKSEIILPMEDHIFSVSADNLIFKGLKVSGTDKGYNGFNIMGAGFTQVIESEITGIGGNGILIDGSLDITVENNLIYNIGSSGVFVRTNEEAQVISNHIYGCGDIVGHKSGIAISSGLNTIVGNNLIHDMPRYGISLLESFNNGTIIEYNDVFDSVKDSQDCGAINSFGTGEDVTLRNNMIHDSIVPYSFGIGLYMDKGTKGFTVYNNIVHHLKREENDRSMQAATVRGSDNNFFNNILAQNGVSDGDTVYHTWPEDVHNIGIFGNIIYNNAIEDDDTNYLHAVLGETNEDRYRYMDKNLYYTANGKYIFKYGKLRKNIEQWRDLDEGFDINTITGEDPNFIDSDNGDYRLSYDSPAYLIGFRDFNIQDIGLNKDYPFANPEEELDRIFVREAGSIVNSANINILTGETVELEVMGRTKTGFVANLDNADIEYSVDNENIVDIDKNGIIHAKESGIAKVTVIVSKEGVTEDTIIYVLVDDRINSVSLIPAEEGSLEVGEKERLNFVVKTEFGQILNLSNKAKFTSSDSEIAEVAEDGTVIARAKGSVMIEAEVEFNGETYVVEYEVEVR